MLDLVWLVPALPLAGFCVLLLVGRRLGEPIAGWLATAAVTGSFLVACGVFLGLVDTDERVFTQTLFSWIPVGDLRVDMGLYVDPLSSAMVLFITGIGALIHLYSIGYMHGDSRYSRFFLYLNFFIVAMLLLVLGDNLLLTFLGWEGVGAASYLLISFWFEKPANASAGKKAFVTNRIGDWGFLAGMSMAFFTYGSISYVDLVGHGAPVPVASTATFIAGMLFVGAIGKSAQFPLFVWLPDAMAGPTPVSALIHAATMVTAGVYLLCRINPILEASYDWLPTLVAWTGAVTALLAATIAVAQHDIKKVLAYSTVSQLGYMFMAVGLGAYWVAIFHMITHAFFKACLFLGSGSVIHGMHENQDMRVMGALRKLMPLTSATFLLSWLAIAGVPPLSGFFSKDEILAFAYQESPALYAVGLLVAVLTAYYMSRQVFLVFFGEPRWEQVLHATVGPAPVGEPTGPGDGEQAVEDGLSPQQRAAASLGVAVDDFHELPEGFHPHESPWTMTVPLVVLAGLALVGGALNLPLVEDAFFLEHWLAPVFEESATHLTLGDGMVVALLVIGALAAAAGGLAAWAVYLAGRAPKIEPRLAAEGWRIDSTLASVVAGPGTAAFEALATVDRVVIDGAVNGVGAGVLHAGQAVRGVQDGQLRRYAALVGAGGVLVVAAMLAQAVL